MIGDIALEIYRASREAYVLRWNIPAIAREYGCTWEKVWAAFALAEARHDVYVARNAFTQEAYTALVPIRKRLLDGKYEIVPEDAREAYLH